MRQSVFREKGLPGLGPAGFFVSDGTFAGFGVSSSIFACRRNALWMSPMLGTASPKLTGCGGSENKL